MERILWVAFTAEARKKQLASHPEFITTFRKGPKWLRPELIGNEVELVNCREFHAPPCTEACEVFAKAVVHSVSYQEFRNITALDHACQSSDMTPENRLEVMKKVYGDYGPCTGTTVITLCVTEVL